jgi:amino acid transporter
METAEKEPLPVKPQLSLWDAVSIILGIIIGAGIFRTPSLVFSGVPGPWEALAVWAVGGLFALAGALCFAELASAYPRSGGEYVYLSRAFGPVWGFLFAWAQLTLIRTGSVAALAYLFADYAGKLWELSSVEAAFLATLAIAVLTGLNIIGVTVGARTQNVLTLAKVLGLLGIVATGLFWGNDRIDAAGPVSGKPDWFASAMIFVLWTYSGWHEAAYIAMEVRNRRRNVPLALLLGTISVTLIYLLVNAAILVGLGFEEARTSRAPAADVLALLPGGIGSRAITVLVMISALGAINGMIFTSARIFAEMGADHRLFAFLGQWNARRGTPVRSLLVQGAISMIMALAVGVIWSNEGFETMVDCTAAVFWLFFLLTAAALFVLRGRDHDLERSFRVPGYPLVPLVFEFGCGYMLYASVHYAPILSLIFLVLVVAGLPVYWWSRRTEPVAKEISKEEVRITQTIDFVPSDPDRR